MAVDWDDVRFFLALAERGGLAAAASALRVSHVTVMRRVRSLEQALGLDLFVRRPDGHRLTTAGADLLARAREGGAILDDALREITAQASGPRPVRIATTEVVANWVMLPHLATLDKWPALAIDASPDERDLLDGQATLAIRFRRPVRGPYRIRTLGIIRMALYAAHGFEDAAPGYIGWTGEFENIGLSRWLRTCFADAAPTLALTTIEAHRAACVAGMGIAGLPIFVADPDPRLKRVTTDTPPLDLTAWLTIPEPLAHRREIRGAARLIQDAFVAAGLK